jgi:hypothetical protein
MISHEQSKRILNSNKDEQYSDEEVKLISEFLDRWAKLSVELYFSQKKNTANDKKNEEGGMHEPGFKR